MAKYKKYVLIASPSRNSEFNNLEAMAQIKANRYQDLPQACRDIQRILGMMLGNCTNSQNSARIGTTIQFGSLASRMLLWCM